MFTEIEFSAEVRRSVLVVETYAEGFAKRLREALGELTQAELVTLLRENGVKLAPARLSHYMQGRNYPDPQMVAELARTLGVSTDWLHGLTEQRLPVADLEEMIANASGESKIDRIMRELNKDERQMVMTFAEYILSQASGARIGMASMPDATAGIERAMNIITRKYGEKVAEDLIETLATALPDLAILLRTNGMGRHKRI
jgi:transcriptional regulator with XRE-family HTH domain